MNTYTDSYLHTHISTHGFMLIHTLTLTHTNTHIHTFEHSYFLKLIYLFPFFSPMEKLPLFVQM